MNAGFSLRLFSLVAGVVTATPAAFASDDDLTELFDVFGMPATTVSTATRRKQSLEMAPALIEVITDRDLAALGIRTVGEALAYLAGVVVTDDLVSQNVGVRGLFASVDSANDTIKVMINGQYVSYRLSNSNGLGAELIPISMVKQIEMIRGPTSALYGANAFLGVVNILTYRPDDFDSDVGIQSQATLRLAHVATQGTHSFEPDLQLRSGGQVGELGFHIGVSHTRQDRSGLRLPGADDILGASQGAPAQRYPSPDWDLEGRSSLANRGLVSKNDLATTTSLYGLISYPVLGDGRLQLDFSYQRADRFGEFQVYSRLTHRNRIATHQGFGRLSLTLGDTSRGLSMRAWLSVSAGKPLAADLIADHRGDDNLNLRRRESYVSFDFLSEMSYAFGADRFVSVGVDYTHDRNDLQRIILQSAVTGARSKGDDPGNLFVDNLGIFGQGYLKLVDSVAVSAGARVDHNSSVACNALEWSCLGQRPAKRYDVVTSYDVPSTPFLDDKRGLVQVSTRLGLVLDLPGLLGAKLLWGSAFKPPTPFQRFRSKGTSIGVIGAPYLKPQTAETIEAQLIYGSSASWQITLAWFRTSVRDMVVSIKSKDWIQNQNFDAENSGFESTLTWKWSENLRLLANVSYVAHSQLTANVGPGQTQADLNQSALSQPLHPGMYPELMARLSADIRIPVIDCALGASVQHVGTRSASLMNKLLYANRSPATYQMPAYTIFDVVIRTVEWYVFSDVETRFSLGVRGAPGGHEVPGFGVIDLPTRPLLAFGMVEQSF